jgi:ABC-type multidrug transport system ATPase subunit
LSDVVLRADGVARRFGPHVALERVDLELRAGDSLAVIGPNGAGKSTLLSILAGALAPSEGAVQGLDGRRPGWVPQRPSLYERLTAHENLELFGKLEGVDDASTRAEDLLATFDIPGDRTAAALSVGNRQRLNVAIALLAAPHVLLLDEPTASLDPGQRRRLWELVEGETIAFSTQNLEEIRLHATRVAVLQRGRLVFDGDVDEYERAHATEVFR